MVITTRIIHDSFIVKYYSYKPLQIIIIIIDYSHNHRQSINRSIELFIIFIRGWCHGLVWCASSLVNRSCQAHHPLLLGFLRISKQGETPSSPVGHMQHEDVHAVSKLGRNIFVYVESIRGAPQNDLSTSMWVLQYENSIQWNLR